MAAVSPDATQAATFDFGRLALGMPGYGYAHVDPDTATRPTLSLMDLTTGEVQDLYEVSGRNAEASFLSHTSISPDGKSLVFFERTARTSRQLQTAVLRADLISGQVERLPLHDASHYGWQNDKSLIMYCRPTSRDPWGYVLVDVMTGMATPISWLHGLSDGHPQCCPAHGFIISDTYPDRRRLQRLLPFDPSVGEVHETARLRIPLRFRGAYRCDFHPRWSRDGTAVCFDSAHSGVRSLCFVELPEWGSLAAKRQKPAAKQSLA